jgi:branched-chain amino acid transport system substrate-binding protein
MFGRFNFASALVLALSAPAFAADTPGVTPGVTETEIKVGATFPFSGPASSVSKTGKGLIAYVNSVNDRGGRQPRGTPDEEIRSQC